MTVSCDRKTWDAAQKRELQEWRGHGGSSDWNEWWRREFNEYSFLAGQPFTSVMEVGCGPYARNLSYVINALGKQPDKVYLSDPLINEYIKLQKRVAKIAQKFDATVDNCPLEELDRDEVTDVCICINVLDHVFDAAECFERMYRALKPGGMLIFGQDLTNDDDFNKHPNTDIMHPIRFDEEYSNKFLDRYTAVYKNVLPRREGRNPPYHYATMIFAGTK